MRDQRVAHITYKAACRISDYVCVSPRPSMRRSAILGERNLRGSYWSGSTVIWVDHSLHGTQLWLTIFHEQIHYLQVRNSVVVVGYDKLLTCIIEREALDFANTYARELNAHIYARTLEVWRELYKCNPKPTTGMHR